MTAEPWYTRAACRDHPPTLFDLPEGEERRMRSFLRRLEQARAVCHTCPVLERCRVEAFLDGGSGVRGGDLFDDGKPINIETCEAAREETARVYGQRFRDEKVSA